MTETTTRRSPEPDFQELERVTIRFAGDSGDGMQLTGTQFTRTAAVFGNDISTLPDFPAEIRAPAGTLAGVSGFQVHFSSQEIHTPGDELDALVAMNPAALKTNLKDLEDGGILVVNSDSFGVSDLQKAGYAANPLDDGALAAKYRLVRVPVTKLNREAVAELKLSPREAVVEMEGHPRQALGFEDLGDRGLMLGLAEQEKKPSPARTGDLTPARSVLECELVESVDPFVADPVSQPLLPLPRLMQDLTNLPDIARPQSLPGKLGVALDPVKAIDHRGVLLLRRSPLFP